MATMDRNVSGDPCQGRVGGGDRKNVAKKGWLLPKIYPRWRGAKVLWSHFSH